MTELVVQAVVVFSTLALGYTWWRRHCATLPSPPGPHGIPFLGNVLEIPRTYTWRYFERLSRTYGSLITLNLAGDPLLVLGDPEDAEELLGRRSHNYSSRKPLIYAGKYQSNNKRLVLLSYGNALKKQRAAFHQMLQPRAVGAYEAIQEIESAKFVYEMLVRPQDSTRHCHRYAASLVFHLSYGRRLADDDEDLITIQAILNNFVRDTYPGAHLVDTFPILDRLPDVLAPWRLRALNRHHEETKFYQSLASRVKQTMDSGNEGVECFAARLWEQQEKLDLDLEELAYVAGSAFEAGTDTTAGTMLWFIMAMVLYPQTMQKAQAEIDSLLGEDGSMMPDFTHINELPYCVALTKEVFRWAPAAPGGFPHYSDHDDEYKGFKIKAQTMVIPCIWTMHHSAAEYPDPYSFNPERFMRAGTFAEHDSLTDGHYGFGFGRRKCPGQYLGSKSIWIGITRMLWAFTISPAHDTLGNPLPVDPENCTSGMSSRPNEFPFRLIVRSENHARTIRKVWAVYK